MFEGGYRGLDLGLESDRRRLCMATLGALMGMSLCMAYWEVKSARLVIAPGARLAMPWLQRLPFAASGRWS
ncbi:hypothetical protein PFICI_04834 [Pestalotiopsis fici W106-1]|uniref:Uncharacterized protein n=1 Tax=Pestalotiopsis fici (strain W106-1 / CGMCC3.15140) TaxID=1229662 RepID=W3XA20_PESFW|nr:uncharacterized protein PFICI_04834 [Pestalotiopsis fici W106-1]ETS82958.1 hypothetical protein PFICI_04834 [Pestalotiopsis fici W106-1]